MSASSRALGALTLAAAMLLPAPAAVALSGSPTTHARTQATTPAAPAEVTVDPEPGATGLPPIATKGWVLADLDTGEILAMHNPDLALRPASTLKLLTALTVVPRLNPAQPYRAVADDETAEGNRVVLYEGLEYTVEDLLHATLLPSANDAAEALARANGGLELTIEQMNSEAARLGANNTTAKNPSGLDEDGQFTTARDLATIGRAALAHPEIGAYLGLRTADFPGKNTSRGRVIYPIYNQNRLVINNFDGALGGKSGYTTMARRTFVGGAERDGRTLLVSMLDIGGNTYTTAQVLLDWAFANADRLNPVGQLPAPSAAAPEYDRTITALPTLGAPPASQSVPQTSTVAAPDSGPPLAAEPSWPARIPGLLTPGLLSPLTVLTLLAAVLVVLRARVYWIGYHRPARGRPAGSAVTDRSTGPLETGRSALAHAPRGPVDLRSGTARWQPHNDDEPLIGVSK